MTATVPPRSGPRTGRLFFTIGVEDSTADLPDMTDAPSRVAPPLERLLELLAKHRAHAPPFFLVDCARRHSELVRRAVAEAHHLGLHGLVVGVANANSTPGFTRKLGFQRVSPLGARLGVGPLPSQDPRFTSASLERTAPFSPNPVRLWRGIGPSRRFQRSLYPPIPARLRPSPLNLIYRDLTGKRPSLDVSRLRFRALDFDAY